MIAAPSICARSLSGFTTGPQSAAIRRDRHRAVIARRKLCGRSEGLDPGPQLDLPGPGAARLAQDLDVALGDRVGVERAVRPVRRIGAPGAAHPAFKTKMR